MPNISSTQSTVHWRSLQDVDATSRDEDRVMNNSKMLQ